MNMPKGKHEGKHEKRIQIFNLVNKHIKIKKMKKYLIILVLIIAGIAIYNVRLNDAEISVNLSMVNIEAIAGCEASSDASKNKGYCVKKYNSTEDVCVGESESGAVRCCGNY
jgi:hypothetical protein